nr:aankyrin repeat family protein [Oriental turtle dovepox virus]
MFDKGDLLYLSRIFTSAPLINRKLTIYTKQGNVVAIV